VDVALVVQSHQDTSPALSRIGGTLEIGGNLAVTHIRRPFAMTDQADQTAEPTHSPSPLDPFLVRFLAVVDAGDTGFQPGPESDELAARLDVPRAFVDALFTSARTRGLLRPKYGRGNKIRWAVSPLGADFLRRDQGYQAS